MSQFKSWFQKAVTTFLDPDREPRVETVVNVIHNAIRVQGQNFSLRQALSGIQFSEVDLREAKERVYRGALERGWSDGTLSVGEQHTAKWLAVRLEFASGRIASLEF